MIFLSFLIVRPFMVAILSAAALAYIFYPLYLKLLGYLPKKTVSDSLSAFFICLLIVILVLIPVIFIAIVLNYELKSGYTFMQNFMVRLRVLLMTMKAWRLSVSPDNRWNNKFSNSRWWRHWQRGRRVRRIWLKHLWTKTTL